MSSVKRFIIHIGYPKTGTTSLQAYLTENRGIFLKEKKILYPLTGTNHDIAHHLISFSITPDRDIAKYHRADYTRLMKELKEEIFNKKPETVIISSEDFVWAILYEKSYMHMFMKDLEEISETIEIVIYIRRQDRILESLYKELIKDPFVQFYSDISSLTIRTDFKKFFDYMHTISKLENITTNLKIDVIKYNEDYKKNTVIKDFFQNLFEVENIKHPFLYLNKSLSVESSLALRQINEDFEINSETYARLYKFLLILDKKREYYQKYILNCQDRLDILEYYNKSNEQLFKRYFSSENQYLLTDLEILYYRSLDEYKRYTQSKIQDEINQRYNLLINHIKKISDYKKLKPRRFHIKDCGYNDIYGYVDDFNKDFITGWVFNKNLMTPLTIEIMVEGYKLCEKTVNILRKDIIDFYSLPQNQITGFHIRWDELEIPEEFVQYLHSIEDNKILDVRVLEKTSGKAIKGDYKKISKNELLIVISSRIIVGNIDKISETNNGFILHGWLFCKQNSPLTIIGTNKNIRVIYGFERTDVFSVFCINHALHSGFIIEVSGKDKNNINITIIFQDKTSKNIDIPARVGSLNLRL